MADAKDLLGRNELVGDDAYEGRHEDRHYPLHRIEPADVVRKPGLCKVIAHRCQICAPDCKLQETHDYQSETD